MRKAAAGRRRGALARALGAGGGGLVVGVTMLYNEEKSYFETHDPPAYLPPRSHISLDVL